MTFSLAGMTNRKDMIDEALTRPGRMEVQMEIGLPNEHGRVQILNIHTTTMREHEKLADDVDIKELAALSKNFSGAEIEGLVRAAQSTAMNRLIKVINIFLIKGFLFCCYIGETPSILRRDIFPSCRPIFDKKLDIFF